MHVTIPLSSPFYVMGAINKKSIQRSDAQLATNQPRVESTSMDAASASQPSSSSAPLSFSSRVEVSLTAIMDKLQLIHADFGSHLDHLFYEICQMNTRISNTRISRITRRQSYLGGFAHSPSLDLAKSSLDGGDDDDASFSKTDDEMAPSQ